MLFRSLTLTDGKGFFYKAIISTIIDKHCRVRVIEKIPEQKNWTGHLHITVAQALGFLLFLFLYKFGDSFATTLQTKFIYDMGFSKDDIAIVVKSTSLWASISAGLAGGVIMIKLGINRALWFFGFVQLITIGV